MVCTAPPSLFVRINSDGGADCPEVSELEVDEVASEFRR
jgi:hypothetical protein